MRKFAKIVSAQFFYSALNLNLYMYAPKFEIYSLFVQLSRLYYSVVQYYLVHLETILEVCISAPDYANEYTKKDE